MDKKKYILTTPTAVPLIFKLLTIVIICVMSNPIVYLGEKAMILLFVYPFDLLFSILILVYNYRDKLLNIVTLIFIILIPLMLLIWLPATCLSIELLMIFGNYWLEIGFWGGLLTVIFIIFDIIRCIFPKSRFML